MNSNEKKAQVAIVIADEIDEINRKKDKEGSFHNDRRVHNYIGKLQHLQMYSLTRNNRTINTWSKNLKNETEWTELDRKSARIQKTWTTLSTNLT